MFYYYISEEVRMVDITPITLDKLHSDTICDNLALIFRIFLKIFNKTQGKLTTN